MLIKEPDPKTRQVSDMDFTFTNGVVMSYTIDKEAGDEVEYPTPETIVIHLAPRVSSDGMSYVPGEDITVFVRNLTTIEHRKREVTERTLAERLEWEKVFQELPNKTIQ